MDKILRAQICAEVRSVMTEVAERNNEVWMTADDLCRQFGMFTKDWLKRYGELLPRQRAEVMVNGELHVTRWAYPRNRIQRMINEGSIKGLNKCLVMIE